MRDENDPLPRWLPPALLLPLAVLWLKSLGAASLWLDEAWEANYYAGFTAAPWYNRPTLYMAASRAMAHVFGPSEVALRLIPALAGLAAVAVTYRLARRGLPRVFALAAAGLFAFSGPFVRESHQLKNYAFDALATALLVLLYARWRDTRDRRRLVVYALAAMLSFGFSFSAIFVVAAIAAFELVAEGFSWRRLSGWAVAHAAIAAVFAIDFVVFHLDGGRDPLLVAYFAGNYAPLRAPWQLPVWLARWTAAIVVKQTGASSTVAALLLAAAGFWRAARGHAVLPVTVLGLALAANAMVSGFERYPYGVDRLSIYAAPLLAVVIAQALALVAPAGARMGWGRLAVVAALVAAVFLPGARLEAGRLLRGWHREEIRGFVARVAAEAAPDETIYVGEDALSAFQFYWCRAGKTYPPPHLVTAVRSRIHPEAHLAEIDRLAAAGRPVWSVLTHMPAEESDAIVAGLDARFTHAGSSVIGDARLDLWRPRGATP